MYTGRRSINASPSCSLSYIIHAVAAEHPHWSEEQIRTEARRLYWEILAMDKRWERSQRRFYTHVVLTGDADSLT